jgi:hypothetical protein
MLGGFSTKNNIWTRGFVNLEEPISSGYPAHLDLEGPISSGYPAHIGLTWRNQFLLVTQPI